MPCRLPLVALALTLATCAFAQPNPGQPTQPGQPGQQPQQRTMTMPLNGTPVLEVTPNGAFILRTGVLVKFDVAGLKPGQPLELFGPLPAQPVMPDNPTPQDREAQAAWYAQVQSRTAPASMLAQDDILYIVIGTTFYRINQKTMALEAQNALVDAPAPGAAGAAELGRRFMLGGAMGTVGGQAPMLKLVGGALYILMGQDFLTVSPQTGKVLNRATLPKELFPTTDMRGMFRLMNGQFGQNGAQAGGMRGQRNQQGDGAAPPAQNAPPPPPIEE